MPPVSDLPDCDECIEQVLVYTTVLRPGSSFVSGSQRVFASGEAITQASRSHNPPRKSYPLALRVNSGHYRPARLLLKEHGPRPGFGEFGNLCWPALGA